jgi:eukaryotic-like serine/threonine-protein kinase
VALAPGTRLGPYEVVALVGAGGMGEVYRARDTKLTRDVALKILPEAFSLDGDRIARFRREAQVLAALNHPNIAAIYGFEDSGSTHALVLELVEGPTLADRIAKGPIPLDETLPIAKQIAEALEAAHEQGIIHRDLKPANIKVREDGTAKVLDFGLAKAMESMSSLGNATMSPTISLHATRAGVLLGTAAYMSPEQARGREVDKRADLWAFGVVLYEMLTGTRLFEGATISDTLASVLKTEPPWTLLPAETPAPVRRLLRRCLEKDRKQRLPDAADIRLEIADALTAPAAELSPAAAASTALRRGVPAAIASAFAALIVVLATWFVMRPAPPVLPLPSRFTVVPPPTQPLSIDGFQRDLAITPDGRQIVYRVGPSGVTEGTQLAVRSLDQLDAHVLTGITGIRSPFVSPDGQWVGFFGGNNGALKKVSILGGPSITLCQYTGNSQEASWGPDDTIIFATTDPSTGLLRVGAAGGVPTALTKPDTAHGEGTHRHPSILPGGRAVLFTIVMQGQPIDNALIAVLDLQTGQKKTVIRGGSDARYVDTGHLVYAAAGTLRAVRFDLGRLAVTSDPVPVVEQVAMSSVTGIADFALAQNGTLVYAPGVVGGGTARTLTWTTRQGREEPINAPPRVYQWPRISPDGARVALDIPDQEQHIWVWDLKREILARLTLDPGGDQNPVWTQDSRRLLFGSARGGVLNLYWQAADNTGPIERLTTSPNPQYPTSISPDGTRVLFTETAPKTSGDVGMLTLAAPPSSTGARSTEPLLQSTFTERNAEVSPDGRWVAYQSNESGPDQIYVRPFPKVEAGHVQVSTFGGTRPVWARSGRELFYAANGALWAVTTQTTGAIFSAGNPTKIFETAPYYFGSGARTYDIAADSQRFLMIKQASLSGQTAAAPSLVVIEHWTEELKQRVPVK